MVMVGVMLVVTAFSLVAVCFAGYLVAAHRARAAADLASLSGAVAISKGQHGCGSARDNADANGAVVASCDQVGDQVDFVITVHVQVSVEVLFPGLPSVVSATAHAGSSR